VSGLPRGNDHVFVTATGRPVNRNNVAKRGLDKAADPAGLNGDGVPKLGFHDLRHTFASHLIRAGVDPVRASRQLGHVRPSITLDIYAHEFDHARGLDDVRDSIDAAFGSNRI
jgi:integrase